MKLISPSSTSNPFRRGRVETLRRLIDTVLTTQKTCTIVDVGGTVGFWATWQDMLPMDRVKIDCINLDPTHANQGKIHKNIKVRQGNACELGFIKAGEYDIAFSNSVIEHVGMWRDMVNMASHFRRISRLYLIQTPYFWFPIEPHARTPLLHWLPESLRYRIVMAKKCGFWPRAHDVDEAMRTIQSASMLDKRQFEYLFPDATRYAHEKFLGWTKALVAIRD